MNDHCVLKNGKCFHAARMDGIDFCAIKRRSEVKIKSNNKQHQIYASKYILFTQEEMKSFSEETRRDIFGCYVDEQREAK